MAGHPLPLAARRHELVSRVERRLLGRCGVQPREIVVGCSGGADSMALLLALVVLHCREPAWRPAVVHVHHGLRADADADATFVAGTSERFDVPCEVIRLDLRPCRGSLGAAAREARYAALAEAALAREVGVVAVAHHAEDQLETMLMALGRGAGLEGLSGMAWSMPLGGADRGTRLVRPLLDLPREQCRDLCRAAGTEWREDPTNTDRDAPRVRLREDVLPVLEGLWPGAATRASGTADLLRAAADALEDTLEHTFGPPTTRRWSRSDLSSFPIPLIAANLRRAALHALGGPCDQLNQRHLTVAAEAIADEERHPRSFDWPGGLTVTVTAREVELGDAPTS